MNIKLLCSKKRFLCSNIFFDLVIIATLIIFFHEFWHVALNGFRFEAVCLFSCPVNNFAGVWLSDPVYSLAMDEGLVSVLGFVTGMVVYKALLIINNIVYFNHLVTRKFWRWLKNG